MTDKSNCWSSFFFVKTDHLSSRNSGNTELNVNFYLWAAALLGSARSIPRRQRCVDIAPQNTEILRAQLHFPLFLYDAALTWCAWLEPVLRPPPPESLGWLQQPNRWKCLRKQLRKKEKKSCRRRKINRGGHFNNSEIQTQTTTGAKGYMKEHNPFLFPPRSSGFLTSLL